ncbi:Integral membrane protein OS=Streptomyces alboniger OX=132473 GN=CP975_17285 PE=4 SV=1 [Streptomyces alboniger]
MRERRRGTDPAQAHRILTDARIHPGTPATTGTGAGGHRADAMSTAAGSSMSLLPSLPMLLGHVLTALAAGWLLRRGDMALLRLAELSAVLAHSVADGALVRSLRGALALVRALRAGLPGTPDTGPRPPHTIPHTPPGPRTATLQHTVIRRGPQTALSLAA